MAMVVKVAAGAFKALGKVKKGTWKAMKGAYKEAKGIDMGQMSGLLQKLGLLDPILKPLNVALGILGGYIKESLAPVMESFFEVLGRPETLEMIQDIADSITFILIPAFESLLILFNSFVGQWNTQSSELEKTWNKIVLAFNFLGIGIKAGWETLGRNITTGWENIVLIWNTSWESFCGILNVAGQLLEEIWLLIVGTFVNFVNGIIDVINFFINAINWIPGVNIPNIPHVDTGGDVIKTGLAVIHRKERVLNAKDAEADRRGERGVAAAGVGRWDAYYISEKQDTTNLLLRKLIAQNDWNEFRED